MHQARLDIIGRHNLLLTDEDGKHILVANKDTGELEWAPAPTLITGSVEPVNKRELTKILNRLTKLPRTNGSDGSNNHK
jgi:hypothetical protein